MSMTEALNASNQNYEVEVTLSLDFVIESDTSLAGWGEVCNHQQTGGPWSQEEQNLHIYCLELLAATLALKTFTKGQTGLSVLLKMDNTTAVAYVNNQGGTVSRGAETVQGAVDMVSAEEYQYQGTTPPRTFEQGG